jgi:hypothetical protein
MSDCRQRNSPPSPVEDGVSRRGVARLTTLDDVFDLHEEAARPPGPLAMGEKQGNTRHAESPGNNLQ